MNTKTENTMSLEKMTKADLIKKIEALEEAYLDFSEMASRFLDEAHDSRKKTESANEDLKADIWLMKREIREISEERDFLLEEREALLKEREVISDQETRNLYADFCNYLQSVGKERDSLSTEDTKNLFADFCNH